MGSPLLTHSGQGAGHATALRLDTIRRTPAGQADRTGWPASWFLTGALRRELPDDYGPHILYGTRTGRHELGQCLTRRRHG